jgi:hypothetical protein
MGKAQTEQDSLIDGNAQTGGIAPATKEYLHEEEKKDPILKKVLTGLI